LLAPPYARTLKQLLIYIINTRPTRKTLFHK
jgi:hypothetical protein